MTVSINPIVSMPLSELVPRPARVTYELLLTARQAISHHDPDQSQDAGNQILFNRDKVVLHDLEPGVLPTQGEIDLFCAQHPVPVPLGFMLQSLTFPEFVAVAFVRQLIDTYNSRDGEGLFSGAQRYEMLASRAIHAVAQSYSHRTPPLRAIWRGLVEGLHLPVNPSEDTMAILDFHGLPIGLQYLARESLSTDIRVIVPAAQAWHTHRKMQSESYAAKAGVEKVADGDVALYWNAEHLRGDTGEAGAPKTVISTMQQPAFSANAIRGGSIRRPAWWHLAAALDLPTGSPGAGSVAPGLEGLFENGGNIQGGAKQEIDALALAHVARRVYPSLAMLGGVTDKFELGPSSLTVDCTLVCRENASRLAGTSAEHLPMARMSMFDMLDNHTHVRNKDVHGNGQMIYGFETLVAGSQFLVKLGLKHWSSSLEHGALVAAMFTAAGVGDGIGGQSARGYGDVDWQVLAGPDEQSRAEVLHEYESYLHEHAATLRQGLIDGTLTSPKRLVS